MGYTLLKWVNEGIFHVPSATTVPIVVRCIHGRMSYGPCSVPGVWRMMMVCSWVSMPTLLMYVVLGGPIESSPSSGVPMCPSISLRSMLCVAKSSSGCGVHLVVDQLFICMDVVCGRSDSIRAVIASLSPSTIRSSHIRCESGGVCGVVGSIAYWGKHEMLVGSPMLYMSSIVERRRPRKLCVQCSLTFALLEYMFCPSKYTCRILWANSGHSSSLRIILWPMTCSDALLWLARCRRLRNDMCIVL